MPTLTQLIQTPQAFVLQTVINENPMFLQKFIDYLTIPPNILLCNERECYLYPSKVSDILSIGMAYRLLIQKKQVKEESTYFYLQKMFANINKQQADPTLLGYCSKVLISLVKKTPQIYEFIKDNQNFILQILRDDEKIEALKQFLSLFLSESTMQLYVFLKSMIIRNIIFRIVEDENVSPLVYKCIDYFYQHILKCLQDVAQDQKPELLEVCKNFEDEHFITLLILKLQSGTSNRNIYIGNFLFRVISRSNQACELVSLHIDTILDFLQDYEQSSIFMQQIRPQHLSILKMLIELIRLSKINDDLVAQIIKRLLVYSNVHAKNAIVHNLLMKAISYCREQGKSELLHDLNIVSFFLKSQTSQNYGFMSLRRRIFTFWIEHNLHKELAQEQKQQIQKEYKHRKQAVQKSQYYKDFKISGNNTNFGSTGLPSDLAAMTIKS